MTLTEYQIKWNRRVSKLERVRRKRVFKYILKISLIPTAIIIIYHLIKSI